MSADPVEMMLDVETLGRHAGCVVLSVAVVLFRALDQHVLVSAHYPLNITEQLRAGATVDLETQAWWSQQPDEAWEAATKSAVCVRYAAKVINELAVKHQPARVWAQGMDFDFPIYRDALRRVGLEPAWAFWKQRDTRTAYDVLGFDAKSVPRVNTHHNALDDCVHQIKCLSMARGVWRGDEAEAKV